MFLTTYFFICDTICGIFGDSHSAFPTIKLTTHFMWVFLLDKHMTLRRSAKNKHISIITRVDGNPYYKDVSISDEWRDFENFFDWFKEQDDKGFYYKGWHVDKDLFSPLDAKIYSKDTCVFLPPEINLSIIEQNPSKESWQLPKAITYDYEYGMYTYKTKLIKGSPFFDTPEEALDSYRKLRIEVVRRYTHFYKDMMDTKVVDKLLLWEPA